MWSYKRKYAVGLLATLIAHQCMLVAADYNIDLQLESYSNPGNTLADGQCCGQESVEGECLGPCDTLLQLCLRDKGHPHGDHNCTFGEFRDLGIKPRGIVFTMKGEWPGAVQLCILVEEKGTGALIDSLFIEPEQDPSDQSSSTSWKIYGEYDVVVIEMKFQVTCAMNFLPDSTCSTCQQGYYGPGCIVHCIGINNNEGHYTCSDEGTIVCNEGYKNEGSNCIQCVPAEGCSPVGGYCNVPGECMCHPGYRGDNCDITEDTNLSPTELDGDVDADADNDDADHDSSDSESSDSDGDSSDSDDQDNSVAPIIGGTVAGVVAVLAVLLIIILIFFIYRRTQRFHKVKNVLEDQENETEKEEDYVTVGRNSSGKKITLPYVTTKAPAKSEIHSLDFSTVVANPLCDTSIPNSGAIYEDIPYRSQVAPDSEDDSSSVCSDQSGQL